MSRMILLLVFLFGPAPALAAESRENLAETKQPSLVDRPDSGIRHVALSIRPGKSLYLSAMQAGIPAGLIVDMFNVFANKFDFQRSFDSDRSFETYYDAKDGTIRYMMMSVSGDKIAFYRYQPNPNSAAVYFDVKGHSANGKFVLSGAELHSFLDAMRKIRATVAAAPLNNSN